MITAKIKNKAKPEQAIEAVNYHYQDWLDNISAYSDSLEYYNRRGELKNKQAGWNKLKRKAW